jgi:phage tail-like protein
MVFSFDRAALRPSNVVMQSRYIVIASLTTCHDDEMATFRDHPYEASNFLVDMGTYDSSDARATFFRVELPDATVDVVAYRNGNEKSQESRKQPGLANYGPLVLKRGLSGSTDLWEWWKQAREGQPNVDRNITITLLDEERAAVWTWRFRNAFPVNYRVDPLDAGSSDIAVEELTLTFDSMDID